MATDADSSGSEDPDMLRRAARACRNAQGQMFGQKDWFSWVPEHLERLADRRAIERAAESSPVEDTSMSGSTTSRDSRDDESVDPGPETSA